MVMKDGQMNCIDMSTTVHRLNGLQNRLKHHALQYSMITGTVQMACVT